MTVTCGKLAEERTLAMLMSVRQALIIALGALEDYLGLERSIVPRRKRKLQERDSSVTTD
jgi:hypothetical protein